MKTTLDIIYFTPADESVKLHWAITGLLSKQYGARHAYGVLLDGGSVDAYFTDKSLQFRPGTFSKVIWVDTRPAIIKANYNRPLIFFADTIGPDTLRLILDKQLTDKSLAALYYSVLLKLKETSTFSMFNSEVWNEYKKMYPDLEPDFPCNCKDCQEEREEKEIDALIRPIVNLLKKRIRENTQEAKEDRESHSSIDEAVRCSCPQLPFENVLIYTKCTCYERRNPKFEI